MGEELGIAFALILVIEGTLYAVFPEAMKRMASRVEGIPASALRNVGLAAAVVGVGIVWLLKK